MLFYPEKFRTQGDIYDGGAFSVPYQGRRLTVIASTGMNWDHVSVSLHNRCPSWPEMCFIKKMFFGEDVWAMQLHPPKDENINNHSYCLHLWRPTDEDVEIPLPPSILVGYKCK